MSIRKDEATGKRTVEVSVEVPGTPEEVWKAIATGEGVTAWFVPTEVKDGRVTVHFGPGMDSVAEVTVWEPPNRFSATSRDLGPTAPAMATEWTVAARDGGTCVVRVVHSLFASTDDWDGQLSGAEMGWPAFFRVLRLYLERFNGEACAQFRVMARVPLAEASAWKRLRDGLGLSKAGIGERFATPADGPEAAGKVEWLAAPKSAELLLLEKPSLGIALLTAHGRGEQTMLIAAFYLYGEQAAETVRRVEAEWQQWMTGMSAA